MTGGVMRDARYARMDRVTPWHEGDVAGLPGRHVAVVGCGALGSAVAQLLVRSGVGRVTVVDRDTVERRNLVDQVAYTEADTGRPKAEAAAEWLGSLNTAVRVEGVVADVTPGNVRRLLAGSDVVVDGADNVETKFLLNDVALATSTPLVYGGCAGSEGVVHVVRPGRGHCLRCLWPEPERALAAPSCRSDGVLPTAVAATAAMQATEVLRLLTGAPGLAGPARVDVWSYTVRRLPVAPYDPGRCPACGRGELAFLRGERGTTATELCGADAILLAARGHPPDLARLARRHADNPSLRVTPEAVMFDAGGCRLLVFASGKTLVHGARTAARARSIHAEHVG